MRYFYTLWSNDVFHFSKILFTDGAIITNHLFHQQIIKVSNLITNEFVKFQYVIRGFLCVGELSTSLVDLFFNIFLNQISDLFVVDWFTIIFKSLFLETLKIESNLPSNSDSEYQGDLHSSTGRQ